MLKNTIVKILNPEEEISSSSSEQDSRMSVGTQASIMVKKEVNQKNALIQTDSVKEKN